MERADDKLAFLGSTNLSNVQTEAITPSKRHYWINQVENDWDDLIPIASKETKAAKHRTRERAIFKLFSFGMATNRDDWLYDHSEATLRSKIDHFIGEYDKLRNRGEITDRDLEESPIKWTAELHSYARRGESIGSKHSAFAVSQYRPFVRMRTFYAPIAAHRTYQLPEFSNLVNQNRTAIFA